MSLARRLLWPLVPIYAAGVVRKNARYDAGHASVNKLAWPVISVGNLSAGGTGKTPLALLLAELLQAQGYSVDVLSRGYGRQSQQIEQVDPTGTASRYGDEPLLMARRGWRVFVGTDRYRAGLLAEQTAPSTAKAVHLLDDGFQHRRLARTVDIVLLTARDWHDTLLPAGNLREPVSALRRASVIALREEDATLQPEILHRLAPAATLPKFWILRRSIRLRPTTGNVLPHRPFAFSGIARPEDFLHSLRTLGCNYVANSNFRDHHAYTLRNMQQLRQRAIAAQADGFVTTEKDAVKLTPPLLAEIAMAGPLALAELHVELLDAPSALQHLLACL